MTGSPAIGGPAAGRRRPRAGASPTPEIALLLEVIDGSYDRRSWHGPTLRGALRGLSAEVAAWRPGPDRHNVWEIALHCAYWKYAVRRRLTDDRRGGFGIPGSDWFAGPSPTLPWTEVIRRLGDEHRRLRAVVEGLSPRALGRPPGEEERGDPGRETTGGLVRGIAAHDLYHAGQIQLIKKLYPRADL